MLPNRARLASIEWLALIFLAERGAGDTCYPRVRLAPIERLAFHFMKGRGGRHMPPQSSAGAYRGAGLSFYVEEGCHTHGATDFMRRLAFQGGH